MKALFAQFDKVVDFPHHRRARAEVDDGVTLVRIYDPSADKPEFTTDAFTHWDNVPGLKELAVRAYIKSATAPSTKSHNTRKQTASLLRRLAEVMVQFGKIDLTPEALTYYDCEELIEFIASLELMHPEELIHPLRLIVDEIWQDAEFDGKRDPHLFVRKVPFPGSCLRGGKREVLPDALFGDIWAKAGADVGRIMSDVGAFWAMLERVDLVKRIDAVGAQDIAECAVWAFRTFGYELPSKAALKVHHPGMAWQITKLGGWKEVVRLVHPSVHDLMPFIALLACQTLFNKAVMTELGLDDIDHREVAGTPRLVVTPLKRRAGKHQYRSFQIDDAPDNPDVLIRFLERYTAGLRELVSDKFKRRLFLFWTLAARGDEADRGAGASAFYGLTTGTGSEDSRFTYAWNGWCKRNKFGDLAFSSLRITGLNLVHRASGGDVRAVAAMASHSSLEVFDHHYKSAHSRARNDRRMGKAMMLRDRMLASGGKIDPTRRLRGEDVEAATPGFGCLDPMASPIPGQREGRPCTAYGQCPACPLATTNTKVPANLVRLKQMEAEYVAAVGYLAPHYWRDKFSQNLGALRTEWLPAFTDPRVIEDASRMQARPLPPLG